MTLAKRQLNRTPVPTGLPLTRPAPAPASKNALLAVLPAGNGVPEGVSTAIAKIPEVKLPVRRQSLVMQRGFSNPVDVNAAIPDPRLQQFHPQGKRLLTRIREILRMKAVKKDKDGNIIGETRFDTAAIAFVEAMESGSFIHLKEYIEREEPKTGGDGVMQTIKMYIGMPVEGADAP